MEQTQVRQVQLVAREGVLREILDTYKFPTENHQKVVELIYKETLDEMQSLGMERIE